MFVLFLVCACGGSEDDDPGGDDNNNGIEIPTGGAESPTSYDGMSLVWEENFDGTTLDPTSWSHETGTGTNGWGNFELQYYRPENTTLQDGNLIITAKEQSYQGSNYTSSRIVSMNKRTFQYGRIDIRAVLPQGQGMWPALWMLGNNFSSVGWPRCGEIDIMEMVGGQGRENEIHGTVHWDNAGQNANYGESTDLPPGQAQNQFNIYSIEWTESAIKWYVNGSQYHVINTTPSGLDEFREEFFFILNLAVGGNWPGAPDATTTFPQHFIVDYIRVFQEN